VGRDPPSRAVAGHGHRFPTTPASFRVGIHALCWVHAERLVHKLVPANDKQRNANRGRQADDLVVLWFA